MEQQHTLYTWSGCRGTPRCQFTHAGMYLLAHLVDVGQRPGLQPGLQLLHRAWALPLASLESLGRVHI